MSKTVTKEKGKADIVADGPGTARQVPESTGDSQTIMTDEQKRGGHINGQPVTLEELEKSTRGSNG